MKRIISFFLVVGLLLSASLAHAETIQEQVNAPESVQETFSSNTGKTVITVDAAVHVPDAQSMYIIPVTSVAFDDAMLPVLAELFWPGLGSKKVEVEEGNDTASLNGVMMKGFWQHFATIGQYATKKDDTHVQVTNIYRKVKDLDGVYDCCLGAMVEYNTRYRLKQTINYTDVYMQDEVVGEGIEDHPLTRAQAVQIGEEFLHALTDEPFELFAIGQAPGTLQDDERILAGTERTGTGYSYALAFTRRINAVPLLPCCDRTMSTHSWRDDLYTPAVGYEQILMAINRDGQITNFMWSNPYALGEATEAQALISFDSILAIARQMMPLKYQWEEARGGDVLMSVDRIDLGYMALLQRDKLSFALTPVWNFYGNLENIADGSRSVVVPLLTVNAIDGTVVDLDYGY
ncbi:MAG: DUF6034 family protein [Clostridia bacterium]